MKEVCVGEDRETTTDEVVEAAAEEADTVVGSLEGAELYLKCPTVGG